MTMISVKNLKKTFGTNRVLRDIDVEIEEGEIVVVVGSSGSGKFDILALSELAGGADFGRDYRRWR